MARADNGDRFPYIGTNSEPRLQVPRLRGGVGQKWQVVLKKRSEHNQSHLKGVKYATGLGVNLR